MRQTQIRESRTLAGRFRGGQLAPVMAVAFKAGEGGMLSQSAIIELDPVAGRLITPVTAQMFCVYVPVQAMTAMTAAVDDPYAGVTEVIRQRALDGTPYFAMEPENELSKRMGVIPRSMAGVKTVNSACRLAHNAAVNYLRKRLYTYAAEVPAANAAMTPALLSSTVLDRFNAVLNPDDHINGMIPFDPAGFVQVQGISRFGGTTTGPTAANINVTADNLSVQNGGNATGLSIMLSQDGTQKPFIDFSEATGGSITLTDLYNAETMDRLTRQMRAVIEANPIDGEEQVLRWAYGMQVDTGQNPFLLHQSEIIFGQDMLKAMDAAGIEGEVTQSRLMQALRFTVPVPRTELGGVVVTFLSVKPDEVLFEQPHPILSNAWTYDNLMAEELQNDPMPVLARDIQAGVPVGDENNVVFYTGFNELRRAYVHYGWNRLVDPQTVDAKNAMWLYEIPASVTPENIIYPPTIPQYPFLDQDAEIARYQVTSVLQGMSPIYIGPTPVETVAMIESENLFGDADQ